MLHGRPEKDWAQSAVFYQIYPMGFCGAPFENDGVAVNRIQKVKEWIPHLEKLVKEWIPHLEKLGIGAIYFSPVFESDTHGYDTRDYTKIDCRLGTNQEFKEVCEALHRAGIRVVLDGVFNHVGRGFWAFQDVKEKREASPYKDWFHINFGGNSGYDDGFWYEGWEGHYELVKLNLQNPAVVDYLLDCVGGWMEDCWTAWAAGWRSSPSTACGWTWPTCWTRTLCAACTATCGSGTRASSCWGR